MKTFGQKKYFWKKMFNSDMITVKSNYPTFFDMHFKLFNKYLIYLVHKNTC